MIAMFIRRLSFLIFALLGIGMFLYFPSATAETASIGQMVWVSGSVQATGSDNTTRSLQRRSPIYAQDTVVTGSNGSGEIVFTDGSMVTLRAATTFRIDQYKFSGAGAGGNKYISSLAKGGFRTITGLISKGSPDNYQVNTPVATIGVRGTDYSLFYGRSGLLVKLDRGAIVVTNHAGSLEMSKARLRIYAQITDLNLPPKLLNQQPQEFNQQPGVTIVSPPPSGGGGGGAAGGGGGNSVCVTP